MKNISKEFYIGAIVALIVGVILKTVADIFNPEPCLGSTWLAKLLPLAMFPVGYFLASKGLQANKQKAFFGAGMVVISLFLAFYYSFVDVENGLSGRSKNTFQLPSHCGVLRK
jgi:hypothetical protein